MKRQPITIGSQRAALPKALIDAWAKANASTPKPSNVKPHELILYGQIGIDPWTGKGITPETVATFLDELPDGTDEILVRINSPGGYVFDGIAIYNALVESGKRIVVKIDALAASIASVIAMAGDEIQIAGNAQVMIHRAWSFAMGNSEDFLQEASTLESLDSSSIASTYAARTGKSSEELLAMMSAETWLSAEEAKAMGFVDTVLPLKGKVDAGTKAKSDEAAIEWARHLARQNLYRQQNANRKRIVATLAA